MDFMYAEVDVMRIRWIRRHELAVVPYRECQQTEICDLAKTVKSHGNRDLCRKQAHLIRPELMEAAGSRPRKAPTVGFFLNLCHWLMTMG